MARDEFNGRDSRSAGKRGFGPGMGVVLVLVGGVLGFALGTFTAKTNVFAPVATATQEQAAPAPTKLAFTAKLPEEFKDSSTPIVLNVRGTSKSSESVDKWIVVDAKTFRDGRIDFELPDGDYEVLGIPTMNPDGTATIPKMNIDGGKVVLEPHKETLVEIEGENVPLDAALAAKIRAAGIWALAKDPDLAGMRSQCEKMCGRLFGFPKDIAIGATAHEIEDKASGLKEILEWDFANSRIPVP